MPQYFPPGILASQPKNETFVIDWYTRNLKALQEPSLWELSQKAPRAEAYRFLYLRSFDNPIAVRLVVADGGGHLFSKRASGKAGYETGHLIFNRESPLSNEATEWFLAELKYAGFWDLPTRDDSREVLDGAQWIVEGVKQGRYHIVDRPSPDPKDPAHILGTALMINLARFRLLYQKVY